MNVTSVANTKNGWLINEKLTVPFDYERGDSTLTESLYLWFKDGGEASSRERTAQEGLQQLTLLIQDTLDVKARSYGYDNMQSARAWRNTDGYDQNELVEKLTVWAGKCWNKARQLQSDVTLGTRAMPTKEQLVSELPTFSI